MTSWSLQQKLTAAFALPIFMLVLIAVIGTNTGAAVGARYNELAGIELPRITALEEMKLAGSRLISSTNEFVLDVALGLENLDTDEGEDDSERQDGGEREEVAEAIEQYEAAFAIFRDISLAHDEDALVDALQRAGQAMIDNALEIIELAENNASIEQIMTARSEFEDLERVFLTAVNAVLDEERVHIESVKGEISTLVSSSSLALGVAGVLATVISVGSGVYLIGSLTRRLRALQTTADGLRAGQFHLRAEVKADDELGLFARTFNAMAARIENLVTDLKHQVTVAEEARARAEKSDQAKSAFLASMSHELRTPLNAIINFTRFVAKGSLGPVNPEQRDTLGEVIDSGRHLLNLINDVLDMSKIEAGSLTLFQEDGLKLAPLLEQVASTGRTLLAEKPVTLRTEIADDLPTIRGDRQRLMQILLNLVSNACKFTDEGEIVLSAARQNGEIVLSVRDTGVGIAPEDQALVFEVFKQTETGLRKGSGTGLGLPIAKSLVEAHEGRLWLESALGKGTTVFVALPAAQPVLQPAAAAEGV